MFGLDKDFGSLHPSFLDIFGTTFFKKDGLSSSMNPDFQRDLNLDSQSLFFQDESGLEGWKGNPWDRLAGSTDGHRSHPGPSCSCLSSRTEPEVRGLGWVPGGSSHTEPEEVRKRRCRRSGPSLPPSLPRARGRQQFPSDPMGGMGLQEGEQRPFGTAVVDMLHLPDDPDLEGCLPTQHHVPSKPCKSHYSFHSRDPTFLQKSTWVRRWNPCLKRMKLKLLCGSYFHNR